MKNTLRKTIALFLASSIIATAAVTASAAETKTDVIPLEPEISLSFIEKLAEYFRGFMAIFSSEQEETSSVEFTMEQGEIFGKKEFFNSSHASTVLRLANGTVISAWFGGSGEGGSDVRIWYATYDGEWSDAKVIETADNEAHWNPVLHDFGSFVRLYYKVGKDTKVWVTKFVDSFDGGKTWTAPQELVAGDTSGGRGPVRNKNFVTADGVIIAPASTEQGSWKAFFDISEDGGNTWTKTAYVEAYDEKGKEVQMIQPTIWQSSEGIHAMFRTKSGYIYRSDSFDGGYTWCTAYSTGIYNNNSGIDCVMTDNGWLWLAYNPIKVSGIRNKLSLAVSKDNGKTWEDVTVLESTPLNLFAEYSYPAIIANGNKLFITYTYKRVQIKYAFIEFEG